MQNDEEKQEYIPTLEERIEALELERENMQFILLRIADTLERLSIATTRRFEAIEDRFGNP